MPDERVPPEGNATSALRGELVAAAHALSRHGLVTAYGHVSARVGPNVLITPPRDLRSVNEASLIEFPLDVEELPPSVPPEAWAHLAIYRSRADVESVARAMPPTTFGAASVVDALPLLHGQASWLGPYDVPVHRDAMLLRSAASADAMAMTLGTGQAVLLRGNGAITVGRDPGSAMARMHVLSAACQVWLQASGAGDPAPLSRSEAEAWSGAGEQLLSRLWRHLEKDG